MPLAVNRNSDQYMWASEVGGDDIGRVKQSALEEVAYLVDYSRWLAVDETISSAVVTHSDATTPDLVVSADELLDDNKVLFKVSEGREGSRYEIRIEVTTSTGQVKVDTLRLSVGSASPSVAFESIWNELSIGTVETGAPGSLAEAEITGDAPNQILNLTIPSGNDGIDGIDGTNGIDGTDGIDGIDGPPAWTTVAAWSPATDYAIGPPANVVTNNGETFVCHTPHTSGGVFDASKFTKIAQKGADGLGAGDMVGANNLSEITSATTARSNLGLAAVASTGAASDVSGLGDAALKNTGTTAGTLAAGDDSRITGAAQKASNLSDLASASTARTNLGLAAVAASGSAADLSTGILPDARMPNLTGDVTTSEGAVATAIADAAVTLAKMANLAANSILGNNTGSPATPLALTASQVRTLLGLATVATSASAGDLSAGILPDARMPNLTGDVTTSEGAVATTIANAVVTFAKMATAAFTASGEFIANTASKLLTPAAVWADAEEKTVTISTTTYTPNFSLGCNFILGTTQTGNFTLANPTNVKVGQAGTIRIVQDGTGGRTWTLGSNWKTAGGAAGVLSTPGNSTDLMHYKVITTSLIEYSLSKAVA